jgi:hypothetical protein
MVYRRKRALAAGVLREFRDGKITNDEYDDRWPRNKGDRVFWAIFDQIWFFYGDVTEYRLTGKYELSPEVRELFDRCILFLESDLEYDWPKAKFGDAHFLFDCPASPVWSWFGGWTFQGITILLTLLLSVVTPWTGFLVPVVFLGWIVCGFGWLAFGVVSLIIRRGLRCGPAVRPEIKYQAGKEWWPFWSREEMAGRGTTTTKS